MSKGRFVVGSRDRPLASWPWDGYRPKEGFRPPIRMRLAMKIAVRDGGLCQLCGCEVTFDHKKRIQTLAEIDHVVPVVDGGSDDESNLRLTCRRCNQARKVEASS